MPLVIEINLACKFCTKVVVHLLATRCHWSRHQNFSVKEAWKNVVDVSTVCSLSSWRSFFPWKEPNPSHQRRLCITSLPFNIGTKMVPFPTVQHHSRRFQTIMMRFKSVTQLSTHNFLSLSHTRCSFISQPEPKRLSLDTYLHGVFSYFFCTLRLVDLHFPCPQKSK